MSGKDLRDAVGLLAVVAGLVFVGFEIQQNTAVARGQTRQELAIQFQDWLVPIMIGIFSVYMIGYLFRKVLFGSGSKSD